APPAASYDALPPPARLRAALAEHPEIGAAKARLAARSAEVELAEERFKPGWAVNLSYGYRDGLMPDGAPRSDFVSVAVTVDLPMFRRNRQDRSLRAALGERRAAGALLEAARRRLASRFEAEYAQWRQLGRRIDLYETTILIQAEDRARAALAAYRSDTGDFAEVMRGRIDELGARLELIRLQFEQGQSHARLVNLGGLPR
ncbi:MAG TPA: TolC family protein, partial [Woeseiaceae bacterium]|nr:TolC family protein [Woeseiaceae bacterium]